MISEDFLRLALRRAIWMRKAVVVGLAGCAGSMAVVSSCVICWLESRHWLLGRPGAVYLYQLLLIRPWSECFDQRRYKLPYLPTSCLSWNVYICLCPTGQDLTQGQMTRRSNYSGGWGKGMVRHELRLEFCWIILVIGLLSTMRAWWA